MFPKTMARMKAFEYTLKTWADFLIRFPEKF